MRRVRQPRHAQIDGLTYWIAGMPASLSLRSRSRLKSEESTPMNTAGRSRSMRSPICLRMPMISR